MQKKQIAQKNRENVVVDAKKSAYEIYELPHSILSPIVWALFGLYSHNDFFHILPCL